MNIEKLKILVYLQMAFDQLSSFPPSWMAAITRIHKNYPYHSQNQHKDLEYKVDATKFGPIFNFNMLLAILDGIHYQNS